MRARTHVHACLQAGDAVSMSLGLSEKKTLVWFSRIESSIVLLFRYLLTASTSTMLNQGLKMLKLKKGKYIKILYCRQPVLS